MNHKFDREGGDLNLTYNLEESYKQICSGLYFQDNSSLAPVYRWYASQCQEVVDLGLAGGLSARALISGRPKSIHCTDKHPDTKCVAKELKLICEKNNIEFKFTYGDDLDVDIGTVDLVHMDSDKGYDHSLALYFKNEHKVRKWIMIHDYLDHPGSTQSTNDFLAHTKTWKIKELHAYSHGLMILERNE